MEKFISILNVRDGCVHGALLSGKELDLLDAIESQTESIRTVEGKKKMQQTVQIKIKETENQVKTTQSNSIKTSKEKYF